VTLRTISYGGGVQSTALIVLATQGKLDEIIGGKVDAALFSNVGDDSEHPATLEYVRNVATPWALERGVRVVELHRVMRDGSSRTLMQDLERDSRSINIPVRMANGAPGNRNCTHTFKVQVVGKWLKANGANKNDRAVVCIGISTDEIQRVNNKRAMDYESPVYPLIELGLDRSACMTLIKDAGLPVPPKSSCYFCPFHRPQQWSEMRRDEPELFWKAADLEKTLNQRRDSLGKDHVYLTGYGKPLEKAIPEAQDTLPGFDGADIDTCDEGYCWT
jgi:hypothetical protein